MKSYGEGNKGRNVDMILSPSRRDRDFLFAIPQERLHVTREY